ncbi:hypothetical protein EDB29_1011100 [Vibrio crassostreae]|uniref:baseplate hub protein n=1 Tax=Vibrio crassostreae TaxID=246167 RepID=UPI00104C64D0|nr:hypothetical protein [Vibrio crassostreae]CAH6851395.1 conserved hypothetical protein [Vibrio chagasii]TCT44288.1 hypothetical protein EDB29_1011100 [Vibrio crassostreae]CAH6948099.1 conserved hypothetical protein [Vibrio chagasii]CAH6993523.1 conserved hypothetical protein [Vibrio chagasii]CAH7454062.1 conserved hypothetical protein [Vibrio chagasii]
MIIDPRVIKLGLVIDGETTWHSDLFIEAQGVKYSSPNLGSCDITVYNLSTKTMNFILKETSPRAAITDRISVILDVGRESIGVSRLYVGVVRRSTRTQGPDVGLSLKCFYGITNKNKDVVRSIRGMAPLSVIAGMVAEDCGYSLSFEIEDKNISSYAFSGTAYGQVEKLEELANAEVYIDNDVLFVKSPTSPSTKSSVKTVSSKTGLLEVFRTNAGVKAIMLYQPEIAIGSTINIDSEKNPDINGLYIAYKVQFDVSNRSKPFYLIVEARVS